MIEVTKYQTNDGYCFDSIIEAAKHEKYLSIVKTLVDSDVYLHSVNVPELVEFLLSVYTMEERNV